jgi:DNA gyrase subunit B
MKGDRMSQEPTYDASSIQVLSSLEAVRKRPGMYIGSTTERGLHNLVFEAADWAVDEVLAGRAGRAEVTLLDDDGVRVFNDGPSPGLDLQLEVLMCGQGPMLGGLGLVVVKALSRRLITEQEGGTAISFWPDPDIFETTVCSFDVLADRFRELAMLNRVLDVTLIDERRHFEPRSLRFHYPDGLRSMVAFLDEQEPSAALVQEDVISFEQDDQIEIALRWRASGPARLKSFANSMPTAGGGVHLDGLRDGITAAITTLARDEGLPASADAVCEGLTAIVSVKLDHASFEGCLRDRLGNTEVHAAVSRAVQQHLGAWLIDHPQSAAALLDRITTPSTPA